MPYLGDYLGLLMSEMTIARMQADVEAVRVAELYASHALLKHMPVPHFRLPAVELDVPVVVSKAEEGNADEPARGAPALPAMRKVFDALLVRTLTEEGVPLAAELRKKLVEALAKTTAALGQPPEVAVDVNRVAKELTRTALETIIGTSPLGPSERTDKLRATIEEAARREFFKLRKAPPRLQVLVTTAEIREAAAGDAVVRLHLKVSEEGLEWTTIEREDRQEDRLVIE